MAKPITLKWTKLTIWPGDGGGPEVFTSKACGLTATNFSISGDVAESNVPDCTDPDAPTWVERVMRGLSSGVSGSGLMAEDTFAFWRAWMLSALAKNCRIVLDMAAADGYFAGKYVLTSFELNGAEADGKIGFTLAMASDGPITWVVGAP